VTRSVAGREVNGYLRKRSRRGRTVLFYLRSEVRGRCCHHRTTCFESYLDEEIMDLLEVNICHYGGIVVMCIGYANQRGGLQNEGRRKMCVV